MDAKVDCPAEPDLAALKLEISTVRRNMYYIVIAMVAYALAGIVCAAKLLFN